MRWMRNRTITLVYLFYFTNCIIATTIIAILKLPGPGFTSSTTGTDGRKGIQILILKPQLTIHGFYANLNGTESPYSTHIMTLSCQLLLPMGGNRRYMEQVTTTQEENEQICYGSQNALFYQLI